MMLCPCPAGAQAASSTDALDLAMGAAKNVTGAVMNATSGGNSTGANGVLPYASVAELYAGNEYVAKNLGVFKQSPGRCLRREDL